MLAKDFPEVLSSLVRVATVGRTLGVHMILATQRPAGVVNDDILANTNLRVALRVQSREDSNNVIGVPDAAAIANAQKGRAYVKLGQDDITPVQTALVTGAAQKDQDNAIEIYLERCRQQVRQQRIAHAGSAVSSLLTISLGVGTIVPGAHDRSQDFLNAVDKLLYQAKQRGRDRLEVARMPVRSGQDDAADARA